MAERGSDDLPDVPAGEDGVGGEEEHHEVGEDRKQEASETTPGKSAKKVSDWIVY